MRVFPMIEGLEELEKEEKWEEARVMLYDLWSTDKENIDFFLRLSSECWFLVAEWEVEKTGPSLFCVGKELNCSVKIKGKFEERRVRNSTTTG